MKIETKKVKLSEIQLNPGNPRTITEKKLDNLKKSLNGFPEMLQLREIVVDETMTILGGNMRYVAMKANGQTEAIVKIVEGLTDDQKREFVIKDNAGFGEWNFDTLANEWDDLPLAEWGIDLPSGWAGGKEESESTDEIKDNYAEQYGVIVICENEAHQEQIFNQLTEQGLTCRVVNT